MRPIKKWDVGQSYNDGVVIETVKAKYNPHRSAIVPLLKNLGDYCCYCEVFSSDLEVEHVIPQNQDNTKTYDWDNFILSCGRCNGKDNKTNKPVNLNEIYLPHLQNTLYALKYLEGGIIEINDSLSSLQKSKAEALIKLVGLDKYPGNPDYPDGFPSGDKRWEHRRKAWEFAQSKLNDYRANLITPIKIAEFAVQRGFFSVWFTVFSEKIEVRKALFLAFSGTDTDSFDEMTTPIPRNPSNTIDSI